MHRPIYPNFSSSLALQYFNLFMHVGCVTLNTHLCLITAIAILCTPQIAMMMMFTLVGPIVIILPHKPPLLVFLSSVLLLGCFEIICITS